MYLPQNALRNILITGTFLLISLNISFGQTKTQQFDELLGKYLEYGKFNGSVLIAHQGKIIYKKGFGYANMEWDIPNAADTKHRLGSITKQFTAMLILQLAADGKIDLQAPITKYLPDYPKKTGDIITTHHLLTHSAGIPNYTSFPKFMAEESRDPFTPDEFIAQFQDMDLEFTPGEQFSYSNSGYFLLGLMVEKLTDMTYEEALREKILKPTGMSNTGYDNHQDILKKRATGYSKSGDGFINADYLDMSIPYAAGSMYATVEDLYLWDQALYTNKLLPQKYMDLFFKPYIRGFGNTHYAYGWAVGNEGIGNTTDSVHTIAHGGGINGFNTIISRAPSDKSLVVLLNNTGGAPLGQMTQSIRGIMNSKSYDLPKKSLAFDLLAVIQKDGIEKGVAHYKANKDNDQLDLNENEMNQVGYRLMRAGNVEAAAEVLKLNIAAFPKSSNVYDSYGEALMNLGDKKGAIKNYTKSVEINPANQNGIDMLEKLGVDTKDLVKELLIPESVLDTYLGKYELMPSFVITISREGTQLKAQATGQPMFDLFAKSDEVFYLKAVEAQITFNKGDDGKIGSLTLFQGGREMEGKRIIE